MPKVLPEYLELRRQQILDAAAACFVRRGFHRTTMQDICDEAGLSPGAVYRYFPSKEEIIEAMSEYRQRQNAERLEQAMVKETTLEAFDELLRAFFIDRDKAELAMNCALIVELAAESPRNEDVRTSQSRTNAAVRERLAELVEHSQARGDIDRSLDADAVARLMVGMYQGFVVQRLVDPDLDAGEFVKVARALFGGTFWHGEGAAAPDATAAMRH